ncbi:dicarboxylate/amino acid:cation symporter [Rummeliibacillus stabekisii]|uniref:Sodium:dicarboxylate symporter n=1 Tax=Rummeliibacillus stabekisii TaxID=241244 RepID=A0A143HBX3_9BACL|nr:dicarboxylate/amino acid:cation symporter [Rummeliibacillus stabekisii]AMW98920.1 sodium:dicarboxylate symporter [Rummeliibacillus stabekisii]
MKLARNILIALVVGAVVGLVMNFAAPSIFPKVDQYFFSPLGTIFINLIKMLVVPLVFFSIALGTANIGDPKKLGKIGVKAIVFFLATTAIAIIIAIVLASVIKPGTVGTFATDGLQYETNEAPAVTDTLLNIIPANPVLAFVEANMLQIIFFSVFIGIALAFLGDRVKTAWKVIDEGNEIMMYLVTLVMKFAPFGTFGLIASAIGKQGFDAIKAMGLYMIVVILGLIVHFIFVYGGAVKFMAKRNPIQFVKDFFPAMTVAFSTSSSGATLPLAMEIAQKKLGVPKSISSFVQPLGATVNMDGTAIMQGVATVFIAQVFGVELTLMQLATVVIIAVLASIGTAAVPGAGLIMLAMVLNAVSLPVEGIALIIGIDRILDMARTAVNVTGDAVCAMYVANTESDLGEESAVNETQLQQAQ